MELGGQNNNKFFDSFWFLSVLSYIYSSYNHVHNILRLEQIFEMIEQIYFSPQVKLSVNISNKLV